MKSIEVRAGRQRYEVLIGSGLLPGIGLIVRQLFRGSRCAVVTDGNVAPLYGEVVCASLREANFQPQLIIVPPGESSKSLDQAGALCDEFGAAGLDRSSFLVSLGGGVIGDLTGFVASIYLRGIPYLSLPTTLLAQVDSCIGGKTGVNSSAGKNLIGTFFHPALVVADLETLQTLPERIWNEGFAEMIKHGIIRDAGLFHMVAQASSLQPMDDASPPQRDESVQPASWKLALPSFIARNLRIKAEIVTADEKEKNDLRALLNFGHTIGHAIEHAAGYGELLHGEAISLGMVASAQVSVRRAGLSVAEADAIKSALQSHHLPTALPPNFPRAKIFAALARDKKFENGRIRFVVVHEIGRASVSEEVMLEDLEAAVAEL
ncbi:3-dehydroquinate synthase [soil metagenome]